MKRMGYTMISIVTVMLALLLCAGCGFLCGNSQSKEITGISMLCNHMNYRYCYSFYLRQEGEDVIFDAQVQFDEEPYMIVLENCKVDKSYFESLKNLDEELGIVSYVNSFKKKNSLFTADDETIKRTTVCFTDGSDKTADSGEYEKVLFEFFSQLARAYSAESVKN